jgi:hypothetical protein
MSPEQVQAMALFLKKRGGWINSATIAIMLNLALQGASPQDAFEQAHKKVMG